MIKNDAKPPSAAEGRTPIPGIELVVPKVLHHGVAGRDEEAVEVDEAAGIGIFDIGDGDPPAVSVFDPQVVYVQMDDLAQEPRLCEELGRLTRRGVHLGGVDVGEPHSSEPIDVEGVAVYDLSHQPGDGDVRSLGTFL